jgi:hypothetical protein
MAIFRCVRRISANPGIPTFAFQVIRKQCALLSSNSDLRGLVTATLGNHGQSVALAARRFNVPAHILVQLGNRRTHRKIANNQSQSLGFARVNLLLKVPGEVPRVLPLKFFLLPVFAANHAAAHCRSTSACDGVVVVIGCRPIVGQLLSRSNLA